MGNAIHKQINEINTFAKGHLSSVGDFTALQTRMLPDRSEPPIFSKKKKEKRKINFKTI